MTNLSKTVLLVRLRFEDIRMCLSVSASAFENTSQPLLGTMIDSTWFATLPFRFLSTPENERSDVTLVGVLLRPEYVLWSVSSVLVEELSVIRSHNLPYPRVPIARDRQPLVSGLRSYKSFHTPSSRRDTSLLGCAQAIENPCPRRRKTI